MVESLMLFIMGMICFILAFALPVLPVVLVILAIGFAAKMVGKAFK